MNRSDFLIAPETLAAKRGEDGLSIVDASWYLPAQNRNGRQEFESAHVPGAVFFDQDEIVDPESSLPHTLPSPAVFAAAAGRLGLSERDTIVVYDGLGLFTAPRVWWMLRSFGARDVKVLDGGFPAWQAAGLPVEHGAAAPQPKTFNALFQPTAVASLAEMRAIVEDGSMQIADARPAERFAGAVPEPRAGVRAGHMPGAKSVPFTALSEGGRLKSPEALREAFSAAGIDPTRLVVTSCGSGVTAAVVNFALASLGREDTRLYDGSWTEWGGRDDTPVATGRD